ncbi:nucleotide exchange factor GrpE [Corynebacterium sp. TA-R-1]|uniref:Protein GrpE n=1 Tax=Corynebacterium stercoris TaxID=2943490 RepID=A0ABT1G0P4_9CORY|nr:nucleotide exchange factor GrpE [Corynebacterium stercoris]MCP1387597.1 nucleotide exchange factor GrpE [Corynebacterium stercoris]
MTNPNVNPPMPDDPGAPENTDEQYVSPDQAESLADEAAEAHAFEAAADPESGADAEDPLTEISDAEIADALEADLEGIGDGIVADADGDGTVSDIELQLAERTEDLQRLSAEYANYRRRTERERSQIVDQTKAKFVEKLLPLLDDLDLAEQHGDLAEGPLKSFGDKLRSTLEGQKLAAFGAEGEAFDPEIHEAVQDLSSGDTKVIGTVLRKGYRLGDHLVRNAMVIIADPVAE